jgi:hypothetical protein
MTSVYTRSFKVINSVCISKPNSLLSYLLTDECLVKSIIDDDDDDDDDDCRRGGGDDGDHEPRVMKIAMS